MRLMDSHKHLGTLRLPPAALAIVVIPLLYFIYLPVSYSFDGTVFSQLLRRALLKGDWLGVSQFHHLLYFPLNYWIYRALQSLCHYHVLEFFHLQLFSMLFGLAALVLVERTLKKLGIDAWLRLAGVSAIAFANAYWRFSVDAEVHMPGLFFTMAGMHLLVCCREKIGPLSLSAACFAVAAGFHLTNVLAVAAALAILLCLRLPWRRLAQFVAVYAASLLLMTGAFALLSGKSVSGILAAGLAGIDPYGGYRIAYSRPLSWQTALQSLHSAKRALVADAGILSWLPFAAFAILLAFSLFGSRDRRLAAALRAWWIWPVPYMLFFSWWDPGNMEFKIHVVVPLLLAAFVALSRLRPPAGRAIGSLLAASLLAINLGSGIAADSEIGRNVNHQAAVAIGRATPADAQVLVSGRFTGFGYGKIYIPYFANREVLILDWLLGRGHRLPVVLAEIRRRLEVGTPLYALEEIAEPGKALDDLFDFHGVDRRERALFAAALRFIPLQALPGAHRLYRVQGRTP